MPANYSYGQLEELWIQAGGPKAVAPLMAAIALAESGGNPAANNYTDNGGTQTSWGLWQVSAGTHQWPGAGNPNDPLTNAKYAVDKYRSQGLTAWGTYDSGAYRQYYQGNTPPSSLPQGGGAGAGTAGQPAVLTGWNIPGPLGIPGEIGTAIAGLWSNAGKLTGTADSLGQIARGFTVLLHAFEWFFVPSHWVRIICFGAGLMFAIPGLYALMKTGSGGNYGDISLALGILLVTIAGILFFIAFHNIPQDVTNLQQLLGWLSAGIRTGKAAVAAPEAPGSAPQVTPDTGLGGQVGRVAGGAV